MPKSTRGPARLDDKGNPARPARSALVRRVGPKGRGGQVRLLWALVGGGLQEGGETPQTHDVVLAHGEQQLAAGVVVHVVHNVPEYDEEQLNEKKFFFF